MVIDDSHEISTYFLRNTLLKQSKLSSAVVVIGALKVNIINIKNCIVTYRNVSFHSHVTPQSYLAGRHMHH